jgi:GTP-binding protein Era
MKVTHSGFVAVVGRPNVGKSTLMNNILGEKLAIVSPRPQTTRSRITGISTGSGAQVIFLDTPGMLTPKNKLGEHMVKAVEESISDVDAVVLVIEPKKDVSPEEETILARITAKKVPTLLVINKTDTLKDKSVIIEVISQWMKRYDFAAAVPVSASTGDGVSELMDEIRALMPEGPQYYPDDQFTTEPERAIAAEMIREKLLMLLEDEVPHGTAVTVEKMSARRGGITDVSAVIYCEKDSHKGIIIGKGGAMLKKIGTLAREDIERMTGGRVNLQLWVKVMPDWRDKSRDLKELGYK